MDEHRAGRWTTGPADGILLKRVSENASRHYRAREGGGGGWEVRNGVAAASRVGTDRSGAFAFGFWITRYMQCIVSSLSTNIAGLFPL